MLENVRGCVRKMRKKVKEVRTRKKWPRMTGCWPCLPPKNPPHQKNLTERKPLIKYVHSIPVLLTDPAGVVLLHKICSNDQEKLSPVVTVLVVPNFFVDIIVSRS